MLTVPQDIVIGVIVVALILILSNRLRVDLIALLVLLTLALTGVVTPNEALSGFSSSVVITLLSLFIITRVLEETGVTQWIATRLGRLGGDSEVRLILVFMAAGALMVLSMNIVAAGAFLLPAAVRVARDADVKPSRLLIPLAFGTLVGGTATYFASANIILSGILQENGLGGLNITDFLPTGSLIVLAGMVYMALIGRHLLPNRDGAATEFERQSHTNLFETYALDERLWEVRVPPESRLANTPLSESSIGSQLGVTVVAIWRNHDAILAPAPGEVISPEDYLLVLGREERVRRLTEFGVVLGRQNGEINPAHEYPVELIEVLIPPRSSVIGQTLKELQFRQRYGVTSVALWRGGRSYRTDVGTFDLHEGDALLMVGPIKKIEQLSRARDFLVMANDSYYSSSEANAKAPLVLVILGVALVAAFFNVLPIPIAMLTASVLMVLIGALSMDDAYRAVEWRVIFLVAGMIPLSVAMINTGLADRISNLFVDLLQPYGPLALVAGIFVMTVALVQIMGGQVTALVVGPVAVTTALAAGIDPRALAVATATACSTAFLLPTAHPVNILMMSPGGYTPGDFTKVGIGMTIVVTVVLLLGMMWFWGVG